MSAFALPIPVIETERLILRGPSERDFDAVAAFAGSERARFVGGPFSRFEAWRGFIGILGHWVLRGFGVWILEHRDSGATAGRTGMIFHDGWDEPELGWHIYDGFEGQGLGRESAMAARAYAARHQGLDRVISYIEPNNSRSLGLATRLGAKVERDGSLLGLPVQIWRHPSMQESAQ